jgi:hypothetical protein
LDNGVYHKFVYSTKDEREDKKHAQEQLLSRNSSRRKLDSSGESLLNDRKKQKKSSNINAEREALKADIRKQIKKSDVHSQNISDEED